MSGLRVGQWMLCWIVGSVMMVGPIGAQEEKKSGEAQQEKPQDLGRWWLRSPLSYDPMPENWLFHAEGQIGFTRYTGNIDGHEIDGQAQFVLRRKVVTQTVLYKINRQELKIGQGTLGELKQEDHGAEYELRVDVARKFRVEAGAMWQKDDSRLIDRRLVFYGGVGSQLIDEQKLKLRAVGALGQRYERYLIPAPDRDAAIVFFMGELNWTPDQRALYRMRMMWFQNAKTSSDYHWQLNAALDFQVTSFMALVLSWETKYDNASNLRTILPVLKKRDDKQILGVKFFM